MKILFVHKRNYFICVIKQPRHTLTLGVGLGPSVGLGVGFDVGLRVGGDVSGGVEPSNTISTSAYAGLAYRLIDFTSITRFLPVSLQSVTLARFPPVTLALRKL